MAIVDYEYYTNTFMGLSVSDTDFPRFETWAEIAIQHITTGRVNSNNFTTLPEIFQTAYKNAICAQISYYAVYGIEAAIIGADSGGFSVGKVRIDNGNNKVKGIGNTYICPAVYGYLEQTGLLNPQIDTTDYLYYPLWLNA